MYRYTHHTENKGELLASVQRDMYMYMYVASISLHANVVASYNPCTLVVEDKPTELFMYIVQPSSLCKWLTLG